MLTWYANLSKPNKARSSCPWDQFLCTLFYVSYEKQRNNVSSIYESKHQRLQSPQQKILYFYIPTLDHVGSSTICVPFFFSFNVLYNLYKCRRTLVSCQLYHRGGLSRPYPMESITFPKEWWMGMKIPPEI